VCKSSNFVKKENLTDEEIMDIVAKSDYFGYKNAYDFLSQQQKVDTQMTFIKQCMNYKK
jgi:hypothetical protein